MPPASTSSPAVHMQGVARLYGRSVVLRNVSLQVARGSSTLLVGANGAGKSTLLRLIAGLLRPSAGVVTVFGASAAQARGRVGLMGHDTLLYDEMTALENLRYFAAVSGCDSTLPPEAVLERVGLSPQLSQRVGDYSQGMRQRTSLARALLLEPELLLLDEPFSNLDGASSHALVALLGDFLRTPTAHGQPRTLLLTTHQPELAAPLAGSTLRLENGSLGNGSLQTGAAP